MAYADITQTQSYLSLALSATSQPTLTQAQGILDDRAAEIDSALGSRGYSVPITSPAWFVADLAVLNAKGAAADCILQANPAFTTKGDGLITTLDPYGKQLLDYFVARLAELRQGIGVPVGVGRAETQQAPSGFFADTGAWGQDLTQKDDFGELIKSQPAFSRGRPL